MHVFQERMGTDACHPEPGVWVAHVLPDPNHHRPTFSLFFFGGAKASPDAPRLAGSKKKAPNEYLDHVAEYTLSAQERKTLTVRLLLPASFPLSKNKCGNGRAPQVSKQIMWKRPRVTPLLFFCKKCDTASGIFFPPCLN